MPRERSASHSHQMRTLSLLFLACTVKPCGTESLEAVVLIFISQEAEKCLVIVVLRIVVEWSPLFSSKQGHNYNCIFDIGVFVENEWQCHYRQGQTQNFFLGGPTVSRNYFENNTKKINVVFKIYKGFSENSRGAMCKKLLKL